MRCEVGLLASTEETFWGISALREDLGTPIFFFMLVSVQLVVMVSWTRACIFPEIHYTKDSYVMNPFMNLQDFILWDYFKANVLVYKDHAQLR